MKRIRMAQAYKNMGAINLKISHEFFNTEIGVRYISEVGSKKTED